jgi:hypothetical protein
MFEQQFNFRAAINSQSDWLYPICRNSFLIMCEYSRPKREMDLNDGKVLRHDLQTAEVNYYYFYYFILFYFCHYWWLKASFSQTNCRFGYTAVYCHILKSFWSNLWCKQWKEESGGMSAKSRVACSQSERGTSSATKIVSNSLKTWSRAPKATSQAQEWILYRFLRIRRKTRGPRCKYQIPQVSP